MKTEKNQENAPRIVRVKDFNIDADYSAWLSEIKHRYVSAQIKAAYKVNAEKLRFNWSIGHDLVVKKAEERWGSGVVEQLSFDLQASFPDEKGFSSRNLWSMKAWFLFFSTPIAELELDHLYSMLQSDNVQTVIKLHQVGAENAIRFPVVLALVPWRHQVNIITKCKNVAEAVFYIKECIQQGWSRQTLDHAIKANLFKTQGKAISNFSEYLPDAQCRMAQEITKDNYDFSFVKVPLEYDEKDLEDALERNITRFLLELGTGFAFVGRHKVYSTIDPSRLKM